MTSTRIDTHGRNGWLWRGMAVLGAGLACTVFFIQLPAGLYAGNETEFNFPLVALISLYWPWALGSLALIGALSIVQPKRFLPWFGGAIAALAVGVWAQGSFLIHDFGLLDGRALSIRVPLWRSWAEHAGIILAVVAFFMLAIKRPKVAVLLLAGLIVSGLGTAMPALIHRADRPDGQTDFSPFYSFSKEKNALVVLLDSMQADLFEEVVAENPVVAEAMDGFTFYPDTTGVSSSTYLAVPTIHSGREYELDSPITAHYGQSVVKDSFINRLSESGYQSSVIAPLLGICPERASLCADMRSVFLGSDGAQRSEATSLLNLSLFRMTPLFLKKTVYNQGQWLISLEKKESFGSNFSGAISNELLMELSNNLKSDARQPTVKFLHLQNTHLPVIFTSTCDFVSKTIRLNREAFKGQVNCALQNFAKLVRALKDKGLYDRTAIILMSDHGSHGGWPHAQIPSNDVLRSNLIGVANPTLAVKPMGSKGPFRVDPRLSSLTDIAATVCDLTSDCKSAAGESVLAPGNEKRVRRFLSYTWARGMKGTDNITDIVAYTVKGRMADAASWHRVPNVLEPGEAIAFAARGNSGAFKGNGWARPDAWGSRLAGPKGDLVLRIRKNDYVLHILAKSTAPAGNEVKVRVIANGRTIGQITLDGSGTERDHALDITRDVFIQQDGLEIAFEVLEPQVVSAQQSALGVARVSLTEKAAGSRVDALPN